VTRVAIACAIIEAGVKVSRIPPYRFAVAGLAAALTATVTCGVTFALTQSSGYHACANAHNDLKPLTTRRTCTAGYHQVTLGGRGPKGRTGPSELIIRTNNTAVPQPPHSAENAIVSLPPLTGDYLVHAELDVTDLNEVPTAIQCRLVNSAVVLAARAVAGTDPGMISLSAGLVAKSPTTITAQCAGTSTQVGYVGTIYATKVGSIK
jgi:hypothetical protein